MCKQIMKVLAFSLLSFGVASGAYAWDYCYKDASYANEWHLSLSGELLHGQDGLSGTPDGAINGKDYRAYGVNWLIFAVDYLDYDRSRYYEWDLTTMTAKTWLVLEDGSVGSQAIHNVVACGALEEAEGGAKASDVE